MAYFRIYDIVKEYDGTHRFKWDVSFTDPYIWLPLKHYRTQSQMQLNFHIGSKRKQNISPFWSIMNDFIAPYNYWYYCVSSIQHVLLIKERHKMDDETFVVSLHGKNYESCIRFKKVVEYLETFTISEQKKYIFTMKNTMDTQTFIQTLVI